MGSPRCAALTALSAVAALTLLLLSALPAVIRFFDSVRADRTHSWLYAACSLSYLGAMVSSNSALQFVNYPTQVSDGGRPGDRAQLVGVVGFAGSCGLHAVAERRAWALWSLCCGALLVPCRMRSVSVLSRPGQPCVAPRPAGRRGVCRSLMCSSF